MSFKFKIYLQNIMHFLIGNQNPNDDLTPFGYLTTNGLKLSERLLSNTRKYLNRLCCEVMRL